MQSNSKLHPGPETRAWLIQFGYDTVDQTQSFCRYGGGRDALQDLWDSALPGALHVVGCGALAKEALVSKVKIEGVADLAGVKIRSPSGLAATVFKAAGAAPVSMSLSDVAVTSMAEIGYITNLC